MILLLLTQLAFAQASASQTVNFTIVPAIPAEHEHLEPGGTEPGYWLHTLMDDGSGVYQWWCDWMEQEEKQEDTGNEDPEPMV